MKVKERESWHCVRCGHTWYRHSTKWGKPTCCPNCRAMNFNVPSYSDLAQFWLEHHEEFEDEKS